MTEQKPTALAVRELLEKPGMRAEIERALPKHLTPERMIRLAVTAIQVSPELQECTKLSLIAGIMEASQLGLEIDPILGQAYLVPFRSKKKKLVFAQLIVGYRGFISLAYRSGGVSYIAPELVFEEDDFDILLGTERRLYHKPAWTEEDRGPFVGAYAIVKYRDGEVDFEWMSASQIDAIKNRTRSRDAQGKIVGPWVTDEDEMRRKTPIRRLGKRLPLTPEYHLVTSSATRDEYREAGRAVPAGPVIDLGREARAELVEMAGEESEPAAGEEVEAIPQKGKTKKAKPEKTEEKKRDPDLIDDLERGEIFRTAERHGISHARVAQVLGNNGFTRTAEVTKAAYPKIIEEIKSSTPEARP